LYILDFIDIAKCVHSGFHYLLFYRHNNVFNKRSPCYFLKLNIDDVSFKVPGYCKSIGTILN